MSIFKKKKVTKPKFSKTNYPTYPFGGTAKGCLMSTSGKHNFIYANGKGCEVCSNCGMIKDN